MLMKFLKNSKILILHPFEYSARVIDLSLDNNECIREKLGKYFKGSDFKNPIQTYSRL